jgi:hypothetical protein
MIEETETARKIPLDAAQETARSPVSPAAMTVAGQMALKTEGQRKVNLIWEYTQATMAVLIVLANILVWVESALRPGVNIPASLSDALFVIVGFYYGRTNHSATGGVGPKPEQGPYAGR